MSTIVAIATALGAGGIGIVRLSGENALQIAKSIFAVMNLNNKKIENTITDGKNCNVTMTKSNDVVFENKVDVSQNFDSLLNSIENEKTTVNCEANLSNNAKYIELGDEPNQMLFGEIKCSEFCDKGYAVYFKAPKSFTGEDIVEFQMHGGVRILDGIVRECIKHGAVPAERGEFTKRAFLNGKMTLADAEGVVDMINAESASAIRAAYRLLDGEFGKQISEIEKDLIGLIAGLEASLDYPDEMEDEILPQVPLTLDCSIAKIENLISTANSGRIVKQGIKIVLVGCTNVGKSSLMNAILKRERAIVTDTAGTTRDLVSESIEYKGIKFNLVDTAGIRESVDQIEQKGVELAKDEIKNADLILFVKEKDEVETEETLEIENLLKGKNVFVVENKCDKSNSEYYRDKNNIEYDRVKSNSGYGRDKNNSEYDRDKNKNNSEYIKGGKVFNISAKFGIGIDILLDAIYELFKTGGVESGEVVTSERHLSALNRAKSSLISAKDNFDSNSTDCILIDLESSVNALGEITGTTASEEVIDQIFARFCVGK